MCAGPDGGGIVRSRLAGGSGVAVFDPEDVLGVIVSGGVA